MQLGLFAVVDHYPDELPRSAGELYGELLEQAEEADRFGLESFWVAEHHFHEYGAVPRPAVWLAAASQRTNRIRLGAAVVVLPFDNPLRVAEDYAMVDMLSNGRLVLGVGSGYLKHEFEGFGISHEEKRGRFDEGLEILRRAWTGQPFSYSGKYNRIEDVALNVTPVQRSGPPLWVAILSNGAAYHVGRRGLSIMTIPYATTDSLDELAETTAEFRRGFAESGKSIDDATVRFGLHLYCAETTDLARREAREAMDRYVRTRLFAKRRSFDELIKEDLVAFGDPDEIVRVMNRYRDVGMTHMMGIVNFGGMPHEKVLDSMRMLSSEVMPKMAKRDAPVPSPD